MGKTNTYKPYMVMTGTTAEVAQQLANDKVPPQNVIAIFYDGTDTVAIYYMGRKG